MLFTLPEMEYVLNSSNLRGKYKNKKTKQNKTKKYIDNDFKVSILILVNWIYALQEMWEGEGVIMSSDF